MGLPQRKLRLIDPTREARAMDGALEVAFASTNVREVNQHFGAAESFAIYRVSADGQALVEVIQFGRLEMDGDDDKLGAKIAALEGCAAVYSNAAGASAIAQLRRAGIHPVKVSAGAQIAPLLDSLSKALALGPRTWLARAIERKRPGNEDRFAVMEAEGWEE